MNRRKFSAWMLMMLAVPAIAQNSEDEAEIVILTDLDKVMSTKNQADSGVARLTKKQRDVLQAWLTKYALDIGHKFQAEAMTLANNRIAKVCGRSA